MAKKKPKKDPELEDGQAAELEDDPPPLELEKPEPAPEPPKPPELPDRCAKVNCRRRMHGRFKKCPSCGWDPDKE